MAASDPPRGSKPRGTTGGKTREPREPRERSLPNFFHRLSPRLQVCYLKSDSIGRFEFEVSPQAIERAERLIASLGSNSLAKTERCANELAAELCRLCRVPPVPVVVRGVRPHNARGELHGLFRVEPPQGIVLWMRTAQRHDVVKPRTFLRTLLHEVCHYLDYRLLGLEDSFHTMGFFRRESFLVRAVSPPARKSASAD